MNWVYLVTTDDRPRVQSRVMQAFDKQLASIHSFVSVRLADEIQMCIFADPGLCGGPRMEVLLLHLEDVRAITAFEAEGNEELMLTLFNVVCRHQEQPLFVDALSVLGATVSLVNAAGVAGTTIDRDGLVGELYQNLRSFWNVKKLATDSSGLFG